MTISTTTTKVAYTGNGIITQWAVNFPITAREDVKAIVTTPAGVDTTLSYGTDYTVTPVAPPGIGATVNISPAVANGSKLTLYLSTPITQPTDYENSGFLDLEQAEKSYDRLTLICQQLAEALGRAIKTGITSAQSPDQLLAFITQTAGQVATDAAAVATAMGNLFRYPIAQFTTTPGVLDYTLTHPADPTSNNVFLVMGGLPQQPGVDFTLPNATTIRFASNPGTQVVWGFITLSQSNPDISAQVQASVAAGIAQIQAFLDTQLAPTGQLGISAGGTGASTVAGARANLDVYSKNEVYDKISVDSKIVELAPQTIIKAKLKAPMAFSFHDLAQTDHLTFSGLVATLQASGSDPFAAVFGNGSGNAISEIVANLATTLPAVAGTYWIYIERNASTGVLTLGATDVAPEYGQARRGVDAMPAHTTYVGAFGVVSTSGEYDANYAAWKAFDRNTATYAQSPANTIPVWWRYSMTKQRYLAGYRLTLGPVVVTVSPKTWTFRTGTGATPDTTVDTQSNITDWTVGGSKVFLFSSPILCQSFEVNVTANNGEPIGTSIGEIAPLFADDYYDIPQNKMFKAGGSQVQRVYVGTAISNGSAITGVSSFALGKATVVPVANGASVSAGGAVAVTNPYGMPVLHQSEVRDATGWKESVEVDVRKGQQSIAYTANSIAGVRRSTIWRLW